jgi:hypothetical protein
VLFASPVEETVAQFMGKSTYESQRNLVRVLFSDRARYLKEDNLPDTLAILTTLKDNGLLRLMYPETRAVELTFYAKENPLMFMRVVNESLQAMGYTYYLTKTLDKTAKDITWVIGLNTQHLVDPVILARQIQSRGGEIYGIEKNEQGAWRYTVGTSQAGSKVDPHPLNVTISLGKPIKPYWIDVGDASKITLRAHAADRWFPRISFFDETLQFIEEIQADNARALMRLSVPDNAKYAQVEDRYALDNIKRGLSLYLERR